MTLATMKNKAVGFNLENEHDRKLFEYANTKGNFAGYIKHLIERDMREKIKSTNVIKTESNGINLRLD